jgi:exodeoxyribonuclease VII small subunit
MTDTKNDTISLEEQFASIEEIIGKMEAGEATLDETFDLYKKGLEKIKAANAMLDDMEKAMLIMNEDGSLEEF